MDDTRMRHDGQRSAMLRILLGLAVILAATVCAWRGPYRGLSNPSDFILIYGPARTWLMGGNPYDLAEVDRVWHEAHGPADLAPTRRTAPGLLYPPTTLLTLAPFAALTWPIAHHAWLVSNVVFLGVALWCIARLAGFGLLQRRTWLFVAGAMVFAPVHTTTHHGQTPLYVMALMLPAFVIASRSVAGALLGLAAAIKPQIALPAVALEAVRMRWRSMFIAIALVGTLLVASVLPMWLHDVSWLSAWRANLVAHSASGAGDLSAANADRHQMVNLQYPLMALTDHKKVAQIATLVACAALAAAFFLPLHTRGRRTPLLLSLSMVTVLTLMVTYHRFYDTVLLLIPLAWAINTAANRTSSRPAWCVLGLLVPFLLNSTTALVVLQQADRLPAWVEGSWAWERLILPHQAWALLIMALFLLLAQRRQTQISESG